MSSLDDPQWATATNYAAGPFPGQVNKQRPPSGNISEGFDPGEIPTEWMNYLWNLHGQWLASLRDGTVSLKALIADGTGGVVSSATSGAALVSATKSGTSLPTAAITRGEFYREHAAYFMWSGTKSGASLTTNAALNVASVANVGTGGFSINLETPITGTLSRLVCFVNVTGAAGFGWAQAALVGRVDVSTYNAAGSSADENCSVVGYWL